MVPRTKDPLASVSGVSTPICRRDCSAGGTHSPLQDEGSPCHQHAHCQHPKKRLQGIQSKRQQQHQAQRGLEAAAAYATVAVLEMARIDNATALPRRMAFCFIVVLPSLRAILFALAEVITKPPFKDWPTIFLPCQVYGHQRTAGMAK